MTTDNENNPLDLKYAAIGQIYQLLSTIEKYFRKNSKLTHKDFDDVMAAVLDTSATPEKMTQVSTQHPAITHLFEKLRDLLNGQEEINKIARLVFPIAQNILLERLFPTDALLKIKELEKESEAASTQALRYLGYILDEMMLGVIDGVTAPVLALGNLRQTAKNLFQAIINPHQTYRNMKDYLFNHPWRLTASILTGNLLSAGLGTALQGTSYAAWATGNTIKAPIITPILNTDAQESLEQSRNDNAKKSSIDLVPLVEKFTQELIAFNFILSKTADATAHLSLLKQKFEDISQLINEVKILTGKALEQNDFDSAQKLAEIAKKADLIMRFITLVQDAKDKTQLKTVVQEIHAMVTENMPKYDATLAKWVAINQENWLVQLQKTCHDLLDVKQNAKTHQEQPDVLLGTKASDVIKHSVTNIAASPGSKRKQEPQSETEKQQIESTKTLRTSLHAS